MPKQLLKTDESTLEYIKSSTLLCVEDNKTTQLLYASIFEDVAENIIFADNGEDGYAKYLYEDIDIIISDYEMPVLNGLEMIAQIRKNDNETPIILVSAIEDIEVIVEALRLNVNNFIKKPIKPNEVLEAVKSASKVLIANEYLEEQRTKKIKELEEKEKYSFYQEDLAFQKELNILRNDFYYQMLGSKKEFPFPYNILIDFLYQPLDILSGDAYSARIIDDEKTFYCIVDGMGKGLSASLSSMLITSHINYTIDQMKSSKNFDLFVLIQNSIAYLKPILLDEEAISIDFIVIDHGSCSMEYAKFAMPVMLMQNTENQIIRIKSNNPPLSKYQDSFKISSCNISNITKFLFYSDGLVENEIKNSQQLYADFIEEDFLNSFTKEDLKKKVFDKIEHQEDDITLIFIHKLYLDKTILTSKDFQTTLDNIDHANEWYINQFENLTQSSQTIYNASVVFTELFMNAYEHGNLGLSAQMKHQLLEDDIYFETLLEKEKVCKKIINVQINKIVYREHTYIITQITDEGDGFDTQILSSIFRNSYSYNGRGVFVSRSSSLGIYYNNKGNSVLYLHEI